MNEEMINEVVENVTVEPETVNTVVEGAKKGLSSGGYIAIGAAVTLVGFGLGWIVKGKVIDPLIEKSKAKKAEKAAPEEEKEEAEGDAEETNE